MSVYDHISKFAVAIRDSASVRDYCVDEYERGAIVSIDDAGPDPLNSDDAPFIIVQKVPQAEIGTVADTHGWQIEIVCGVKTGEALSDISTERTASANGLQQFGNAKKAEDLLALVLSVIRDLVLDEDAYIDDIADDSDGWSMLPLQTAAASITVRRSRTMKEW